MPEAMTIQRGPMRPHQDTITVQFGLGIKARMEGFWGCLDRPYRDICRQKPIEGSSPLGDRQGGACREAGNLTERVYPRVGSSRSGHGNGRLSDLLKSTLHFRLDCLQARLNLPTVVPRAVVFERQFKRGHGDEYAGKRELLRKLPAA